MEKEIRVRTISKYFEEIRAQVVRTTASKEACQSEPLLHACTAITEPIRNTYYE